MNAPPIGWDHPDTAHHYARFQRRFERYRQANVALVRHAALAPGMRVLDVGAGDGGTAAAALGHIGEGGTVLCFEPAAAMRALGERTLREWRVTWTGRWPVGQLRFDRVLCGAAIWQFQWLEATLRRVFELLRPGGCLCFDIPASYLGEPDPPGGGRDPLLFDLSASLVAERALVQDAPSTPPATSALTVEPTETETREQALNSASVESMLAAAGFRSQRWRFATRLSQRAYSEWLKIPPTTDRLFLGLDAGQRARMIDRAFERVDASSWRWERWIGWTAWKLPQ